MRLGNRLDEKDKSVLQAVKTCRQITGRQLMRLLFDVTTERATVRAVNRRLFKLKEMGLITHLERRIGGVRSGSGANIWEITTAGLKLLYLRDQADGKRPGRFVRKRHFEPTTCFTAHRLAVTEVYVRLHELTGGNGYSGANTRGNGNGGDSGGNSHNNRVGASLAQIELEPGCWRRYSDFAGHELYLKPDAYAVTASGEYEDHWFIEMDLATESPAVVTRKCEQYAYCFQGGTEQRRIGVFPRVVWIVPTDKRKNSITNHIDESFAGTLKSLFTVIRLDGLADLIRGEKQKAENAKEEEKTEKALAINFKKGKI
ncbi:MAG: replication-relaxation family protein [Gracilibacteraceae bacterium]|jgi:hypothetical protein|nr:replication-relaxation family protein [Gracilibacteraceae bacterium]